MKKNFKVLLKIIFLFLFSVELNAKGLCEMFDNKIYQSKYDREFFVVPVSKFKTLGFALKQKWNPEVG